MKRKLEEQVRFILENYPDSRNSDIYLMNKLWKQFYPEKICIVSGQEMVRLADLYELPREDNIKRIRAKIQNYLHELVPTEWKIAKKRKFLESEWKQYLNYPSQSFMKADAEIEKSNRLFNPGRIQDV